MTFDLWRKRIWHLRSEGVDGLREFERRRRAAGDPKALNRRIRKRRMRGEMVLQEWPIPEPATWRGRRKLKVGVIADSFTLLALDYEWDQVVVDPKTWRDQLEAESIDLFFAESAWHGNADRWKGHFTGPNSPSRPLREFVDACKASGVPTVFWNKEDPVHFEDFLESTRIFDWVFTSDADSIPKYTAALDHARVAAMPFAAQPAIHNPMRPAVSGTTRRAVAFAGTYFRDKYPERREQMEILLGGALDAEPRLSAPLDIYSRFQDLSDAYRFPEPYVSRVRGELTYPQMLTANRLYNAVINVNSVVDSSSMCARRIFEATACGAPVVGVENAAVSRYFPPEEIVQVRSREQAAHWFRALDRSPELRDRMVHLAQRRIWREHTFSHRIDSVLDAVGLGLHHRPRPTVSALISTNRPNQITHVLAQMAAQKDVDLQVLVLTHGFEADVAMRRNASDFGLDIEWIQGPREWSLGQCYNALVEQARGDVLAKIDDDDLYGQFYLFDQLAALNYSNADVVGKHAHHMFLEGRSALCLRFPESELTWSHFVAGPTIVGTRETFRAHPFEARTTGEDSAFLKAVTRDGGRVFSSDRFGFVQVRSASRGHTWAIADSEILSTSRVIAYGKAFDHVLF